MLPDNHDKAIQVSSKFRFDWKGLLFNAMFPVAGMLAALLIGAIMLLLLKVNPLEGS